MFTLLPLGPGDAAKAELVRDLASRTFYETYAWGTPVEMLDSHVGTEFTVEKIAREMRDPSIGFFFVTAKDEPAAYLKILAGRGPEGVSDPTLAYLERSYVLKKFQGAGIGRRLMDEALAWSRARGLKEIWLRAWTKNVGAVEFYKKMGFQITGETQFVVDLPEGKVFSEKNHVLSRRL